MLRWTALFLLIVTLPVLAEDPQPKKEPRSKIIIMLDTRVVAGKKLKGPAAEYQPDNDPNTIELVILGPNDEGPSHVSEDGEVIFQRGTHASQEEVDSLLDQAFEIRVKRENAGT